MTLEPLEWIVILDACPVPSRGHVRVVLLLQIAHEQRLPIPLRWPPGEVASASVFIQSIAQ